MGGRHFESGDGRPENAYLVFVGGVEGDFGHFLVLLPHELDGS